MDHKYYVVTCKCETNSIFQYGDTSEKLCSKCGQPLKLVHNEELYKKVINDLEKEIQDLKVALASIREYKPSNQIYHFSTYSKFAVRR